MLELYSSWIPNWSFNTDVAEVLAYFIYYGKFAFVWINSDAFFGSILFVIETLIVILILKSIQFVISFIRGANVEY